MLKPALLSLPRRAERDNCHPTVTVSVTGPRSGAGGAGSGSELPNRESDISTELAAQRVGVLERRCAFQNSAGWLMETTLGGGNAGEEKDA